MKKKKHWFKYPDPEAQDKTDTTKKNHKSGEKTKKSELVPQYIFSDLKRTIFTIISFLLLLLIIYLIQTKSSLLNFLQNSFNF